MMDGSPCSQKLSGLSPCYDHDPCGQENMSSLYEVQFSLCDSSTTLKEKFMKALKFTNTQELIGLIVDEFSKFHVKDQVDFF